MSKSFIVVQEVWVQTSSDYDAVKRFRTLAVTPETSVGEIMEWANIPRVLGSGDVVITAEDDKREVAK